MREPRMRGRFLWEEEGVEEKDGNDQMNKRERWKWIKGCLIEMQERYHDADVDVDDVVVQKGLIMRRFWGFFFFFGTEVPL